MIIVGILITVFMLLFMYCVCKVSSECSRLEEQYLFKGGFDMNDEEKVYVIVDEGVWNDSNDLNIIGCSTNQEIAEKIFAKHVKKVKDDIDFYDLDTIKITSDIEDRDDKYIYEETENYFSIYLDGYYDTDHILIKIEEIPLTKEIESDLVK